MTGLKMDMHISRPIQLLIAFSLLLLIVFGGYLPMLRTQDRMAVKVEASITQYENAVLLAGRYRLAEQEQAAAGTGLREPLFSYLERVVRDLGLEERIDSIRPGGRRDTEGGLSEIVDVSLKGISLKEFVDFLYHIEVLKREIFFQSITIKKDSKDDLVVRMTLGKIE